jgi:hypothetical protein
MHTETFSCPYCGQKMGHEAGPNWTSVPGIATSGDVVVLSCTSMQCQRAIGAAFIPRPRS